MFHSQCQCLNFNINVPLSVSMFELQYQCSILSINVWTSILMLHSQYQCLNFNVNVPFSAGTFLITAHSIKSITMNTVCDRDQLSWPWLCVLPDASSYREQNITFREDLVIFVNTFVGISCPFSVPKFPFKELFHYQLIGCKNVSW